MKAVLTDIDGTLVSGFAPVEFIRYLHKKKIFPDGFFEESEALVADMQSGRIAYLDWLHGMCQAWAKGIQGLKEKDLLAESDKFFEADFKLKVFPSSQQLIEKFHDKGYVVIGISVGSKESLAPVKKYLALDRLYGTEVEVKDGVYTGQVVSDLHTAHGKKDLIQRLKDELDLDLKECFGLGDTLHDLQILERVGQPLALNPNSKLQAIAREKGFLQATHENVLEKIKPLL